MVPGLALEHGERDEFLVASGVARTSTTLAVLGQHDEVTVDQHDLAVSVAASLPHGLARLGVTHARIASSSP
jgi:hypothetical protein